MLTQSYWFPEMIIQQFSDPGKQQKQFLTSFDGDRGSGEEVTGVSWTGLTLVQRTGPLLYNCAGLGRLEPCTTGDYVV